MGIIHQDLHRLSSRQLWLLTGALLLATAPSRAQLPSGLGQATDFSSVEYYDAPFEQQIKTRLSGAESRPVPDHPDELEVFQLRIENYSTNGTLEALIRAPECLYSTTDATARSAGPLAVSTGDGQLQLNGVGFLWCQNDTHRSLIISNQVDTVIRNAALPVSLKP